MVAGARGYRYAMRMRPAIASRWKRRSDTSPPPTAMQLNTENVLAAAAKVGVDARRLPGDFLELRSAGKRSLSHGSDFELEQLVPWLLCGDKLLTSMILSERGLPVARYGSFGVSDFAEALEFARRTSRALVTKPTRGTSGGAGVTVNVRGERELTQGFTRALAYGHEVMIEEYAQGENVRVTVLDEEVVGVVRRTPAHVVGDGVTTIAQLVSAKNRQWAAGSPQNRLLRPIELDGEARRVLRGQGLEPGAIPPARKAVNLRQVCNADQGGEVDDITSIVHDDYRHMAVAAATAVGTALCGVDLIVPNIEAPAAGSDAVINEVNTTPALYVANGMVDGAPSTYTAERVLRRLFEID